MRESMRYAGHHHSTVTQQKAICKSSFLVSLSPHAADGIKFVGHLTYKRSSAGLLLLNNEQASALFGFR